MLLLRSDHHLHRGAASHEPRTRSITEPLGGLPRLSQTSFVRLRKPKESASVSFQMLDGWTVFVRRRPRSGMENELWDCAISTAAAAERAVRRACNSDGTMRITARTRLTGTELRQLGLQSGEIRKPPNVVPATSAHDPHRVCWLEGGAALSEGRPDFVVHNTFEPATELLGAH
jgi:hypothetical protein